MIYTPFDSLTDDELIASVCNDTHATPREIELVSRVIALHGFLDDARAERVAIRYGYDTLEVA